MLSSFTFNGRTSTDFGIKVEKMPTLNRSARKFRVASVPGHNGNIYELQDAWEEIVQPYQIFAGDRSSNAVTNFSTIAEWLHSADGYAVLTDTYDPTHYREAVFVDSMDIESEWHTLGRTTINFRCRPEHYIVTNPITVSSGGSVMNSTNHNAFPKITLTGSGASNLLTMENRAAYTGSESPFSFMPLPSDAASTYVCGITWRNPVVYTDRATFVSVANSTGTLTFKSNYGGNNTYGVGFPVAVEPNATYTISGNYSGGASTVKTSVFKYTASGEYIAVQYVDGVGLTFSTGNNIGYVVIAFTASASSSNHVFSSLMLNKGKTAQPFRAYTGNTESSITINDTTLVLSADFSTAEIDCDRENVTMDGVNSNRNVRVVDQYGNLSASYLQLLVGANTITYSGDITAVSVEPRFWEL